jgi:hypothetical protein
VITRLLALLAVALGALLAGQAQVAPPATASCAYDVAGALQRGGDDVVFIGVDERRVEDGDRLIIRFRVERVHRGEVRRTQDVLMGEDEDSANGVDWSPGDRVLVLGQLTEDGAISTNYCVTAAAGSAEYDAAVAQLGEGAEPVPGVDPIAPDGLSRRDLLWVRLAVGVVGLAALGLVAARWLRSRRRTS